MSGWCNKHNSATDPDHCDLCSDERIADLEKQLAEKDKEIERMRPMLEECRVYWNVVSSASATFERRSQAIDDLQTQLRWYYEQSTKPDGGTET